MASRGQTARLPHESRRQPDWRMCRAANRGRGRIMITIKIRNGFAAGAFPPVFDGSVTVKGPFPRGNAGTTGDEWHAARAEEAVGSIVLPSRRRKAVSTWKRIRLATGASLTCPVRPGVHAVPPKTGSGSACSGRRNTLKGGHRTTSGRAFGPAFPGVLCDLGVRNSFPRFRRPAPRFRFPLFPDLKRW
jgi:hypothetical protein